MGKIDGPKRPLTQTQIARLTDEGWHADGTIKGLFFVVHAGARIWVYRRQVKGKRFQITVGSATAPIGEVRKRAAGYAGMMPDDFATAVGALSAPLPAEKKRLTFSEAAEKFIDWRIANEKRSPKFEADQRHQLEIVKPIIGSIPLDAIKPADIARIAVSNRSSHTIQVRISFCSQVFNWSLANEFYTGINPADLRGPLHYLLPELSSQPEQNQGALPVALLPDFFAWLYSQDLRRPNVAAFLFSILTATRSGSVRRARWDQIEWEKKLWVIPEDQLKVSANGALIVPLAQQTLDFLQLRGPKESGLIFPGRAGGVLQTPVFSKILKSAKKRGITWLDEDQSKAKGRPIYATQHGIARATFRTWAQDDTLGNDQRFDPLVAELCLHHKVKDKYRGAYSRGKLMERRRELMTAWADYCFSKINMGAK